MRTKETEKSIELYKVVLFVLVIVVIVVAVVKIKNKKKEENYVATSRDVTQVSQVPTSSNKTAQEIKILLETKTATQGKEKEEPQEYITDASVGETIRFKDFYIIPQEVNEKMIVFKFDTSSNLKEYDSTSQTYVKKEVYTINKGEKLKFSDGSLNQNIYTLTY